mgnify:CR=1 FL=1
MTGREKQKKLRELSFKKNKENQKGGRPSGRVRGGGVASNPANLGGGKKVVEKKKSSVKKKGEPTKAQKMAKANIKKYGGTAKAAAANKEANRLRIKKAYMAKKKKK